MWSSFLITIGAVGWKLSYSWVVLNPLCWLFRLLHILSHMWYMSDRFLLIFSAWCLSADRHSSDIFVHQADCHWCITWTNIKYWNILDDYKFFITAIFPKCHGVDDIENYLKSLWLRYLMTLSKRVWGHADGSHIIQLAVGTRSRIYKAYISLHVTQ